MKKKDFLRDIESVYAWHGGCGPLDDLARAAEALLGALRKGAGRHE